MEIGLVGTGPWGAHILRDLRALGAVVHAVARSPESIARAKTGGAAEIVAAPDALPPTCDGFVVANRTLSHLDAVEELLPRGRPIFVEKPLGMDVARAKRLAPAAHRLVFVMHKWRYHPGIIELARIAASGEYGPVEGLRSFRLSWGTPHLDVSSLWALAPHEMAIALTIFGEVPRPVAASQDALTRKEAAVIAHLRTSGGTPITFEVSPSHPTKLRRIMLKCRDALLQLEDSNFGAVAAWPIGAREPRMIRVSDEMPLFAELRAFCDHVRGGPPPMTALAEEIEIMEAIAKIDSMATRG
ncbi:MAG: Gfo/Idh/MocA family oxidoreductase [Parvularculaceae bacterium]